MSVNYNSELAEELKKSLCSIVDGDFIQGEASTRLQNLVFTIDYFVAKEIISDLSQAFQALYNLRYDRSLKTSEASRFCYILGNRLKTIHFSRDDYKYFIETASYPFLPYLILSEFIPVDLVINGNFEDIGDEFSNRQNISDALGWFYKRRYTDIIDYTRKNLSGSVDCSTLSDEMVLKIAGIKV